MRQLGPIVRTSILLLSFAFLTIGPAPSPAFAQAKHSKLVLTSRPSTPLVPKAPDPSLVTVAPPGSALYVAKRGDSIPLVARHYLSQTSFLTSSELSEAIRSRQRRFQRHIPQGGPAGDHSRTAAHADRGKVGPGVSVTYEVRAVYLTGIMAASDHGIRIVKHWREVGGNAVVFDIKDSDGSVTIPFDHPLLGAHRSAFHDLPKFIHFLHSQNMHAIARIAIFRDQRLVETHPELAVKSHKTGQAVAGKRKAGLDRSFPAQSAGV